jgi:hypothetical protein
VTSPASITLDVAEVAALLARILPLVDPEDHAKLTALVGTLLEVVRLAQKRGATIARLRSILGQRSSEKTADVVGVTNDSGPKGAQAPSEDDTTAVSETADADAAPGATPANDAGARRGGNPKGKGHGRLSADAYDAERIAVPHPTLAPGATCPACASGTLYVMKSSAPTVRIVGQAPLVALRWECECLRCNACEQVHTAPLPEEARGPKYSESAASTMVVLRYGMGMPLHRLAMMQRMRGVPVPASTQWQVAREHVVDVLPVYDVLVELAANAPLVHNDDTYVRILEYMGKRRAKLAATGGLEQPERTGLFTTGIVAMTTAGPVALFGSGRQHAGENLADLLDHRDPTLPSPIQMCDGLERNRSEHPALDANCLAHGRRNVVDEVENHPELCGHFLGELRKVFFYENHCRKNALVGAERLAFHQQWSGPVMTGLRLWIAALFADKRVEPNSGLGAALTYMVKRWDALTLFLRVADAPLENNAVERALKLAIRLRRASLFYLTRNGAFVGDVYTALLVTTHLHGGDPFHYLEALFTHAKAVALAPHDWLPWNYRTALAHLAQPPVRAAA